MANTKKATKKATAPATETKAEKFQRIAPKRVVKIINSMRAFRKMLNRTNYDWTDEQADKILTAIMDEAQEIRDALRATKAEKETVTFEL